MKNIFKYFAVLCLLILGISAFAAPKMDKTLPLKGNSMANIKLQSDTLVPVYSIAGVRVKNCDYLSIADTKVTKQPYNLKSQDGKYIEGQWEELWVVNACGKKVNVPITFILDSVGTTFSINLLKVKVIK